MSMPGKQPRVLCPVCQEPIPPDETECRNCGAFVIDEAVVRLSRAFGLDREKALKLFEAGFRHTKQLRDRDPNGILEKGEVGLLFICTNCGGFVAAGDAKCPRWAAEVEAEPEAPGGRLRAGRPTPARPRGGRRRDRPPHRRQGGPAPAGPARPLRKSPDTRPRRPRVFDRGAGWPRRNSPATPPAAKIRGRAEAP